MHLVREICVYRTVGQWNCDFFDDVESLKGFGAANKESLAELVWAFFEYWAWRHDYNNSVISIRTGGFLTKSQKEWTRRVGNERHLVCIEVSCCISHLCLHCICEVKSCHSSHAFASPSHACHIAQQMAHRYQVLLKVTFVAPGAEQLQVEALFARLLLVLQQNVMLRQLAFISAFSASNCISSSSMSDELSWPRWSLW